MSQTLHVAQTGSNANSGSVDFPFRDINFGLARVGAGDTLLIGSGNFREVINNVPLAGISWSNKIRIAAYPGASPWLVPPVGSFYGIYLAASQKYLEFDGINIDGVNTAYGAIKIEENNTGGNAHHIRVQNAEIMGNPGVGSGIMQIITCDAGTVPSSTGGNELISLKVHRIGGDDFTHGIYVKSSNNIIDNCDVYNFPGGGIHLFNNDHQYYGNIVRNNLVHDGRSTAGGQRHWGIILANGSNTAQVYNNIVYGIPNEGGNSAGILLLFAGSDNLILNNTVTGNAGAGINVGNGDASPTNTVVKNNISYNNLGGNYLDSGTGTIAAANLFSSNPLFVNAAAFDFRLQATSPCIDAGVTV